jgi:hypothetical protein
VSDLADLGKAELYSFVNRIPCRSIHVLREMTVDVEAIRSSTSPAPIWTPNCMLILRTLIVSFLPLLLVE